jgi:hypothetical protein
MPGRRASAIVLVLVLITVILAMVMGSAYFSSGRRRVEALTIADFKAFELASSAIDLAVRQTALEDVFPASPYRTPVDFMTAIATDDEARLRATCSGCSEYRPLKDPDGRDGGRIWVAWTFPSAQRYDIDMAPVIEVAKRDPAYRSLTPVTVHPLRFRRDLVVGRWQNWGVLRFEATAVVQDAVARTALTLTADRMFSVEIATDPLDGHITGCKLAISAHNLRTSVKKT